jgi:hypothetical protein
MRYIKKYETLNAKYDVGDYVLLDLAKIYQNNEKLKAELAATAGGHMIDDLDEELPEFPYGKIIEYESTFDWQYEVEVFPGNKNGFYSNIKEEEIVRHLTQTEITEFKMLKKAKKYNL